MSLAITVILPVRNGELTLDRAVRTTLRALPDNGRVLIHDDASTDRTPDVLAAIKDPRLTVVRSESAQGVAGGLNLLLSRVDTPLLARMDADDVTLPWRFRVQVNAVSRGADVVFTTVVAIGDVPGQVRPGPPIAITAEAMPLHLMLSNAVAHSSMLARTDTLVSAGGYRAVPAEDYELWLRLCAAGTPCVRLARPGILYRFHQQQVTAAVGWSASSSANPELKASYAALSQHVLGRQPEWYEALTTPGRPTDAAAASLGAFVAAMREAAGRLPTWQRMVLLRKVAAVARRVEEVAPPHSS